MLNSDTLEVAVGLSFVFLLMSSVATAAREVVEAWLKTRGNYLEQGLMEMFDHRREPVRPQCAPAAPVPVEGHADAERFQPMQARSFLENFYRHTLIFSLFRGVYLPPEQRAGNTRVGSAMGKKLPSYIPSQNFARAVLDVVADYARPGTGGDASSFDRLSLAAQAVPNDKVRQVVLMALAQGQDDLDRVQRFLEDWYNGAMDRVAGLYKRHTQNYVFWGGLLICVALNVNTLTIGHALSENSALRRAVGASAEKAVDRPAATGGAVGGATDSLQAEKDFRAAVGKVQELGLPIGWGNQTMRVMLSRFPEPAGWKDGDWRHFDTASYRLFSRPAALMEMVAGWLMTAFAMTLGAPFWFDLLNQFMIVRGTVKPAEKSGAESAKDPIARTRAGALPPPSETAGLVRRLAPADLPEGHASEADMAEIARIPPDERPREGDEP